MHSLNERSTSKMHTSWTPFPKYSLAYTPTVGAALNAIKTLYTTGIDYYQEADHEPPFMSDKLIADFDKVYEQYLQPLTDIYNNEFGAKGQLRLSNHFHKEYYPLGTPLIIIKVASATRKIAQLVEFERWVHQSVLASQQQKEQEAQRAKEAWTKLQEQYSGQAWPVPGDRNIIMFMATRIQRLEELVAKLLDASSGSAA
jgi:hypothetical protein